MELEKYRCMHCEADEEKYIEVTFDLNTAWEQEKKNSRETFSTICTCRKKHLIEIIFHHLSQLEVTTLFCSSEFIKLTTVSQPISNVFATI